MKGSKLTVSGIVRLLLLSASGFVTCGTAFAQVAVPVSKYVVIQPIAVCKDDGSNCPIFGATCSTASNNVTTCTTFNNPDAAATSPTTPIGFLDVSPIPNTTKTNNVNITRQIWWQAGIDVTFLPMQRYNNTNFQSLGVSCTKSGCDSTGSPSFQMLSQGSPTFPVRSANCITSCDDPAALPNPHNAINLFFIHSLVPGNTSTPSPLYGFGWLNANGIAIASDGTFANNAWRYDTIAHELGHNLNLDHTIYGAGPTPTPTLTGIPATGIPGTGPADVMTAGASRKVTTNSLAEVNDVTPPNIPPWKTLDYLTLTSDENTKTLKVSQQTVSLKSGFINPSYDSVASAGGGLMAAASLAATTGTAATASSNAALTFTVDFPALSGGGPNGRSGAILANVVVTPPGNFNVVSNTFLVCDASHAASPPCVGFPTSTVNATGALLHGNNGVGNPNCAKPTISGPSIECLVVTIDPKTPFTADDNKRLVFSIEINNGSTPITLAELAGTDFSWIFETDQFDTSGNSIVAERVAMTSVFQSGGSTVSSQFLDPANPRLILNPDTFVGFTSISCTPGTNGKCPKPTGGNWATVSGSEP
jgi:hypothetical protein